MFQDWPVRHTPEPRKTFDPPLPVTIDLGRAFARTPRSMRQGLALRVKAEGIALTGDAPGLLRVWIRTTSLHQSSRSKVPAGLRGFGPVDDVEREVPIRLADREGRANDC